MVKDARNILKLNENLGRISQDIVYEKLSTGFALPNLSLEISGNEENKPCHDKRALDPKFSVWGLPG